MASKKKLVNVILSFLYGVFDSKKHVVFVVPAKFHAEHLYPVIEKLMLDSTIKVHLVGQFDKNFGLEVVYHYSNYDELSLFTKYSVFVLTGLNLPWQFAGKTVFFGHGIGPKLKYQVSKEIAQFDHIFAPCEAIYEVQKNLGPKVHKVGLPLLDKYIGQGVKKLGVLESFKFDSENLTICYAPSWSDDELIISDIEIAINNLASIKNCNIIVSPHPNLLDRDKYSKAHVFDNIDLNVNKPNSAYTTLDLCIASDIVISDISSILYESMALNKGVFFDGNDKIYADNGATKVMDNMLLAIPQIVWGEGIESRLLTDFKNYNYTKAKIFIDSYLYNKGSASSKAKHLLMEIV